MANINTNIENNSIDNKSFALLRTNPSLTSNVKLVVDSGENIFLSAFRASKELSKVDYQKYELTSEGILANDIAKFYKRLPNSEKYQTLRKYSDITLYSDYEFQYEDQYNFGASFNTTKLYDEQYKIFAPIWVDKTLPSTFVVYRVNSVDYEQVYTEDTVGQNNRVLELLKNATIIKTFDLSNKSNIGKYLNSHVNDKLFPKTMLTVNFEEGEKSSYNGIDIKNGGFVKKHEILEDYYTGTDFPEILNNETITKGFERNSVVSANIINLEFLFDDEGAEDYKIYRYFGLYADQHDEGSFKPNYINKDGKISIDPSTYKTTYDLTGTVLSDLDMLPNESDLSKPTLNYVKDKDGKFYHVKNLLEGDHYDSDKIRINIDKITRSFFEGYAKTGETIQVESSADEFKGFLKINIVETPENNDKILIADKNELDILEYNLSEFLMIADSSLPDGQFEDNRFSTNGGVVQVAMAIGGLIKNMGSNQYNCYVDSNSIIIEDYAYGNRRRQSVFAIYGLNFSNFVEVETGENNSIGLENIIIPPATQPVFNDWNIWTMIGGSSVDQGLTVLSENIGELTVGKFVKQLNYDRFIKVIEVVKDPFNNEQYRVILDKQTKISKDSVFEVYREYDVIHGRFTAYDFRDFDFDFYSTKNSELGDLVYEDHELVSSEAVDPAVRTDIDLRISHREYFTTLTPVLEDDAIDDDLTLEDIRSEYDRLKENNLKETSINSRVVPTINKFSLVNASNARMFDYFLNANEAFGPDNLSPNNRIASDRNPEYLNMEHFHFNKIPEIYYTNSTLTGLTSFLDFNGEGGITIDELKSTDFNYFKRYFQWNGCFDKVNEVWVDDEFKKLYSVFSSDSIEGETSTVFRGLRYSFRKRKESKKSVPTEFTNSSEIDNYKFGVVLTYNNDSEKNSTPITVIKNDVFKFICVYIELNTVRNKINEINRISSYELINLEDSNDNILDVEIPFQIDFGNSTPPSGQDDEWILEASDFAKQDGSAKFTEFVTPDSDGLYSGIYFEYLGSQYICKVINVLDDERVLIGGLPYLLSNGEITQNRLPSQSFGLISIIPSVSNFKYYRGGANEFSNLLESINSHKLAKRFDIFDNIKYLTIQDGNTLENQFMLRIEDGTEFTKPSLTTTAPDPEKPKAYQLSSGEVGKVIVDRKDGGYVTLLRRMNGGYNPITNNVISFTDIYTRHKVLLIPAFANETPTLQRERLIYNRFNDLGVSFASYKNREKQWGFIPNYFYHKVNDENTVKILKLSQTSDKLPVYPKIGEIAIDKKDMNLFNSKYSSNHFTKSLPAGISKEVYGTLSPVENKNFMVSTIMKVKNNYDLTAFSATKESSVNELDNIRLNYLNTSSIHWFENEQEVVADFYLPNSIAEELKEDGIEDKFKKYVDPTTSFGNKETISDDLDLYINSNIVNRFIIDSVEIYGIESKAVKTQIVSVDEVSKLKDDGFKKLTNYTVKAYQNDALSFRLIYNKRNGYSYKFKIHVKIEA